MSTPLGHDAADHEHDEVAAGEHPVVAEGLGHHRPGESLGEWLRNDLEQTKADLHIGKAHKHS